MREGARRCAPNASHAGLTILQVIGEKDGTVVITAETITFMRKLDVKEIHGYHAAHGLKLLTPAALANRRAPGRDA